VKFKIQNLKGYVELNDGEITCHKSSPKTLYMKKLIEKAENWKQFQDESTKPDFDKLSEDAKEIVEKALNEREGYAFDKFTERMRNAFMRGESNLQERVELWQGWLHTITNKDVKEAGEFLAELHEYEILHEEV